MDLRAHFGSKGPFGGTVSCAITHNGFVYLGTREGGVFESTNTQLVAWRARPVGLKSGKISALAHSGSYLFAATADSGVYIFNGSVGSDRYWNKINSGLGTLSIRSLVALDSITVLAGTDAGGLYKTTNKGASWTAVNHSSLNGETITSMAYSGSRIFLSTEDGGVFISDDGGGSWADFNDANTLNVSGTISISYNATSDELYVLNANGLYLTPTAASATTPAYMAGTGLPLSISVRTLTNNGSHWFLASDLGIFTEQAGVAGWSPRNAGLGSLDVTAVVALPDTLIAGVRKEGVYLTSTALIQWKEANASFNNTTTRTMTSGGDSLVVAVTEDGVFVSKNLATSYVRANNGLTDSTAVNDILLAGHLLLAATTNGGVFSSADSGKTWSTMNGGLNSMHILRLFYANGLKYAFDAGGTVYYSTLQNSIWTIVENGLPSGITPSAMCFYGNRVFLGTLGNGVFWKDHSDTTWTSYNTGLVNLSVTSLAASGNRIYAGTQGSGIFISGVETANWNATALPGIPHSTMLGLDAYNIQDIATYGGFVYASYKGGLVTTSDSGATWIAGGNQFNLPTYTDVNKICFVKSRVFVTTEYNAVYSNALAELPIFPDTFLVVSKETFDLEPVAPRNWVTVNSNSKWTVSTADAWISVSFPSDQLDGVIAIDLAPNNQAPRTGQVLVTAGSKSKIIIINQDGTNGLKTLEDGIVVYPNPNSGTFRIDLANVETNVERISVYTPTGEKILDLAADGGPTFAVEGIASPGVYIVQVQTDRGTVVKKVVVH